MVVDELKVGDRFLLCNDNFTIMTITALSSAGALELARPYETDCATVGYKLYKFELEFMEVDGYRLIKIENEQHLLHLQLKYS